MYFCRSRSTFTCTYSTCTCTCPASDCGITKVACSRPSLLDPSLKRTPHSAVTTVPTNNNIINSHRETLLKNYDSSGMIVLDLIKNVPVGSSIFTDSYFSSTKLIKKGAGLRYRVTCTL